MFAFPSPQAWAVFKGKFKEGDKAEPATWKTRLRCALNKSPDFEEVTERSQLDISEPYKVYRIVPEEEQKSEFVVYVSKMCLLPLTMYMLTMFLPWTESQFLLLPPLDGKSSVMPMAVTTSSGDITDMDCSPAELEELIKEVSLPF